MSTVSLVTTLLIIGGVLTAIGIAILTWLMLK